MSSRAAVVAGGAKGIGAASAQALSNEGVSVVVFDRDAEEGRALADGLPNAIFVEGDVSKAADAERAAEECVKAFGRLDVLVNSAGIQRYGTTVDTPEEVWDEVLDVNLKSMFLMSKFCVPKMMEGEGGAVVNIASVQGLASQRGVAAYSASKGGAIALTRSMAVDFAPKVRVNCICPGSVDTPMLRESAAMFAEEPEKALNEWGQMHPISRIARAEEIGSVVVFLAGPGASFITGASIIADGGLLSILGGT